MVQTREERLEKKRAYNHAHQEERRGYMREYMRRTGKKYRGRDAFAADRGRAGKKRAVEYKGGQCRDCGLITCVMAVYEFDHRDPNTKDRSRKPGAKWSFRDLFETWSWERVQEELDKCDLVCANCHRKRPAA